MSFAVEKEAWALIESGEIELTDADKLVLLKCAFWANGERECWHGIKGFVEGRVTGRTQVIKSLKKLATEGIISKRPRPQPEGRGRATDVIVVHPAAKSHTLSLADQSPLSDAAKSTPGVQQSTHSGGRTNKALEKASENSSETTATIGNWRRNLPLPKVGRFKVTEEELFLAAEALAQFNRRNSSRLRLLGRGNGATESLKRIVERIREVEGIDAAELRDLVDRSFDNPWWEGPARVGNIFGPKAFQGAVVNDGIRRNKSGRTARLNVDRQPNRRSEEDEEEPW